MKKIIIGFVTILLVSNVNCQDWDTWYYHQDKDEFGDLTGERSLQFITKNCSFSNEIYSNQSCLASFVYLGQDITGIAILEYGNSKPVIINGNGPGDVKVKLESGEVIDVRIVYEESSGVFLLRKGNYPSTNRFIDYLYNGKNNSFKMSIKTSAFSDYGSSSYIVEGKSTMN